MRHDTDRIPDPEVDPRLRETTHTRDRSAHTPNRTQRLSLTLEHILLRNPQISGSGLWDNGL